MILRVKNSEFQNLGRIYQMPHLLLSRLNRVAFRIASSFPSCRSSEEIEESFGDILFPRFSRATMNRSLRSLEEMIELLSDTSFPRVSRAFSIRVILPYWSNSPPIHVPRVYKASTISLIVFYHQFCNTRQGGGRRFRFLRESPRAVGGRSLL